MYLGRFGRHDFRLARFVHEQATITYIICYKTFIGKEACESKFMAQSLPSETLCDLNKATVEGFTQCNSYLLSYLRALPRSCFPSL